MWLDEYMLLTYPIFESYLNVRKEIQNKIFKRGISCLNDIEFQSLIPLIEKFNNAITNLGIGNQLTIYSNLPEVRIGSMNDNLWVSLSLYFQVIHY